MGNHISTNGARPDEDAVDLREVMHVLRRGARWIVVGVILGIAGAGAVTSLLPPTYEATSKVLLPSDTKSPASALTMLTGGAGGGLGSLIGGAAGSAVDTEMEILTSRSGIGSVVDSLGLQVRVLRPKGIPSRDVVASATIAPDVQKARYRFERAQGGFSVTGPDTTFSVQAGVPFAIPGGELTLRSQGIPDSFTLEIRDREWVISKVEENLERASPVGDVVQIDFQAADPYTAAAVPNALFQKYFARRTTTDRGVNRRRFEFLLQKEDSIATELARAENQLRQHQEVSGVFDPKALGSAELEHGIKLSTDIETLDVELNSLRHVLAQIGQGGEIRELAAFPTFLQNAAINDILTKLVEAETELVDLTQGRRPQTAAEPDVIVMTQTVSYLEGQLQSLARDYLAALESQRRELGTEFEQYRGVLAALPARAQQSLRLEREVTRLSETQGLLQAQLVDARLAAIAEGGDVRQVDVAVEPLKRSSPKLPLNLAIGVFLGLLVGSLGALGQGYLGQSVRDPWEAELAAGIPAISLSGRMPVMIPRSAESESIVLLPLGNGSSAGAAARRLASTAAAQGRSVAVVDLATTGDADGPAGKQARSPFVTDGREGPSGSAPYLPAETNGSDYPIYQNPSNGKVNDLLDDLEKRFSLVVIASGALGQSQAEGTLSTERPVALIARKGKVTRAELQEAVKSLQRAGITMLGVILD